MKGLAGLFTAFVVIIILTADFNPAFFRRFAAIPNADKMGHFILMGIMAYLINIALGNSHIQLRGLSMLKGTFWLSLLVVLEELAQIFIDSRSFDLMDLFADFTGIVFFSWLAVLTLRRRAIQS